MKFQSTKLIDGFSTCFRQEKSAPIMCSKLHGYSLSFKVTFVGELDYRNWVMDYGFLKRTSTKIYLDDQDEGFTIDYWFKYMFDHTVIIAEDDTQLEWFKEAEKRGILQLRILPQVGCEKFAEFVFKNLNAVVNKETNHRVRVVSVECFEHEKNSAIYEE